MSEIIIGIDLGTTNSEVSLIENGQVLILNGELDHKMLPSVVGLDDEQSLLVGTPAKNQYVLHPDRTIKSVKRKMGQDEPVHLGQLSYSPQEISAMILKQLKQVAEKHLGHAVEKAVITVPAYFSDVQRQATRDAGQIAGLDVVRIINEPTAAALAYQLDDEQDKKVLVYDLGGGTFDVSVVSLAQGVVEVLASHGNNQLGGDDFDHKIVEVILDKLKEQSVDISDNPQAMARIERLAEQAKVTLSDQPFVTIEAEFITSDAHLSFEMSREEYEQLIDPFIIETLEAIHTALEGAKMSGNDIDEVILVGGSSRTPLVHKRLKEAFSMVPRADINPDLCVATGAAIQGGSIAGQSVNAVLVDITPYTFGTSAMGEMEGQPYPYCYVPIIEKYSPLPVNKSEVFFTVQEGQKQVDVNVFQGEQDDALKNIKIGEFRVEGLDNKAPENSPIVLTLNLDINGILKVTALEKHTGLSKSITIDNALSGLQDDQLEDAKQRVQSMFDSPVFDEEKGLTIDHEQSETGELSHKQSVLASALIEKAQRLMDTANSDDKDDLIDMSEALKDALSNNDAAALEEAESALSDLIYYLES